MPKNGGIEEDLQYVRSVVDGAAKAGQPGWAAIIPYAKVSTSSQQLGRRAMFLPAQYAWFEPVLIASIVVFIIDLMGNSISFGNRYVGALTSAVGV